MKIQSIIETWWEQPICRRQRPFSFVQILLSIFRNESFLPFSMCRTGAMDAVISGGTDQSFSKSFEKTETNSIIRTTFLDSIGAHEIYSSEVRLTKLTYIKMLKSIGIFFFLVHLRFSNLAVHKEYLNMGQLSSMKHGHFI